VATDMLFPGSSIFWVCPTCYRVANASVARRDPSKEVRALAPSLRSIKRDL
jgi:hypothetical protein